VAFAATVVVLVEEAEVYLVPFPRLAA